MNRRLLLNCFLISLILNLGLLLVLSIWKESTVRLGKEAIAVEFSSVPQTLPRRRAVITMPRSARSGVERASLSPASRVDNFRARESIDLPVAESELPVSIASTDELAPDSPVVSLPPKVSQVKSAGNSDDSRQRSGATSRSGRPGGSGDSPIARQIVPPQPKASISGSGDKLSGFYNISLVSYEDRSDTTSADALIQIALAMNRWTQIKTKVESEPIMLDDPELLEQPLIYITSSRPFAFSERERKNLREYFKRGGFLMFSNTATSESAVRAVANSIEFELWKVLAGNYHDPVDLGKDNQVYGSFFDIQNLHGLRGLMIDGRISAVYENSGYGKAWSAGKDTKREPYLKLGVNIVVYALTTSPMVYRD